MASVDKQSVREEVNKIKSQFELLGDEGKLSAEVKALMSSMLMIMELILSIFLERKTTKNNKNSSIPSSQTDKDESSLPTQSHRGQNRSKDASSVSNTRTVETVIVKTVDQCACCGEDLSKLAPLTIERRTQIDIIFEKTVEHFDAQVKRCPVCATTSKGSFPANIHGPLQYGNGIKAYALNLLVSQMVALGRVQQLISSMMSVVIAQASILQWMLRLHQKLEPWEQSARMQLLSEPVIHVDESVPRRLEAAYGYIG